MAEKKAHRAAKRPPRADDKRGRGKGDNSLSTVHATVYGTADPLFNFNDRRGSNGMARKAM